VTEMKKGNTIGKHLSIICLAILLIVLSGCSDRSNHGSLSSEKGEVVNRDEFTVSEYNVNEIYIPEQNQSASNSSFIYDTLESYEQSRMVVSSFHSGTAAIVLGKKVGTSESYYRDGGLFVNDAGYKEQDITAFSLTQVEVLCVYDGVLIKAENATIKKGDIITVIESHWMEKDDSGKEIIRKPYGDPSVPIADNTVYIMYLSKINEGAKFHKAILNNVWVSGRDMFIINDETRLIRSREDVNNIKENDKSKYFMNEYLYPFVIEKYG
jgi:hypothetical protein